MKIHTIIQAGILSYISVTCCNAGAGITGPCTQPEGKIKITPDVEEYGTAIVPLGGSVTLEAEELKDKDCYCGSAIQDTIDPNTGVKWKINQGTLTGGDTGTPKSWKPTTPKESLRITLSLNDSNSGTQTTNDGDFIDATAVDVNVVVPNIGSNNNPSALSCSLAAALGLVDPARTSGLYKLYDVTGNRTPNNVDFQGAFFNEAGGIVISNTCGGSVGFGSNDPARKKSVGSSNTAVMADMFSRCDTTNFTPNSSCSVIVTIDWSISADGSAGTYYSWGRFNGSITVPSTGGINASTIARSWKESIDPVGL